jgi:glutathione S-transferase
MLTLYYSPGACSLAPHIILEESGVPFDTRRIAIASGDHRSDEYLAINPHGRVPALAIDDEVVTENAAILTYVATLATGSAGLPRRPLELARVYELLSFFASSVHIAFAQYWRPERFTEDENLHGRIADAGRRSVLRYFDEIEALLAGREWLVGDGFTLADTYPFVFYRWGLRIGVDMAAYRAWTGHVQRMLRRPAVARALAREGLDRAEFLPKKAAA